MTHIFSTDNLLALISLTGMEVVLGIDNIVFLSLLVSKLPKSEQNVTRKTGLVLAMGTRILLLCCISWVMALTTPLFSFGSKVFAGRDLILLGGGLFLITKATREIHERFEPSFSKEEQNVLRRSFWRVIVQILLFDVVFSLDSVITAIGMAQELWIMIVAVVGAVFVMLIFSSVIARFIEAHPTLKVLALSFLLLIGVMLVAESFGKHIEKGYIYFAMAFSLGVEVLNIRTQSRSGGQKISPEPQL